MNAWKSLLLVIGCIGLNGAAPSVAIASSALGAPPQIVRQTVPGVAMPPGGAFGHTVQVSGTEPIAYQWFKDGVPLPGKTAAGFGINGVTLADAGSYTLVATNAYGSVASRPLRVSVTTDSGWPSVRATPGLIFRNGGVGSTTLVAQASGSGPITHQWYRNGEPMTGETGPTLVLQHSATNFGDMYYVAVTNSLGTATGNSIQAANGVPPSSPPSITTQPIAPASSIAIGTAVTLSVAASGPMPISYAWFRNGQLLPGMLPTYTIASAQVEDGGAYYVQVANTVGAVTSQTVTLTVAPPTASEPTVFPADVAAPPVVVVIPPSVYADGPEVERILNISTRSQIGAGSDVLVAGFVIAGSESKRVLIRAVGPGIAALGAADSLENPSLAVYQGASRILANDDWQSGQDGAAVAAAGARVGAFPLATGSKDAAVLVDLTPGAYTVHLTNGGGHAGIGMVEVYDAAEGTPIENSSRISNISTRAFAGAGDRTLIAGVVLGGDGPQQLLIRGVGPGLTSFGVSQPMSNPVVKVYRGSSLVASNDDWSTAVVVVAPPLGQPISTGTGNPLVSDAVARTGASVLPPGRDAALVVTLDPGAYTVHVTAGPNIASSLPSTLGPAMIEAYEIRPRLEGSYPTFGPPNIQVVTPGIDIPNLIANVVVAPPGTSVVDPTLVQSPPPVVPRPAPPTIAPGSGL